LLDADIKYAEMEMYHHTDSLLYCNAELRSAFETSDKSAFENIAHKAFDELLQAMCSQNFDGDFNWCYQSDIISLRDKLSDEPEYKSQLYAEFTEKLHKWFEDVEKAEQVAHSLGLPFDRKPYDSAEEFDPYAFNPNRMSVEDYELMHRLMDEDGEEQEL
jgi:hypothetical protein